MEKEKLVAVLPALFELVSGNRPSPPRSPFSSPQSVSRSSLSSEPKTLLLPLRGRESEGDPPSDSGLEKTELANVSIELRRDGDSDRDGLADRPRALPAPRIHPDPSGLLDRCETLFSIGVFLLAISFFRRSSKSMGFSPKP
tara:strand:+ start:326 stop:751 length:426 start_codon:yes stop_codon:yes gene_type:complete